MAAVSQSRLTLSRDGSARALLSRWRSLLSRARACPEEPRSRTALVGDARREIDRLPSFWWDRGRPCTSFTGDCGALNTPVPFPIGDISSRAQRQLRPVRLDDGGFLRIGGGGLRAAFVQADRLVPLVWPPPRRELIYYATRASPAHLFFEVRRSRASLMSTFSLVCSRGPCCHGRQMNELWQS